MSDYIRCTVNAGSILELCAHWSGTEQMVRLESPIGDNEHPWRLPWVWANVSDLAQLIFPQEDIINAEDRI